MNPKIEQYIEEQRAQIAQEQKRREEQLAEEQKRRTEQLAEEQKQQREALLDSLGIYKEEKEYTDQAFEDWRDAKSQGYAWEVVDGKCLYYKVKKKCPKLTDEEYEALLAVQREKEALGMIQGEKSEPTIPGPEAESAQTPAQVAEESSEQQVVADSGATESFGGKLMKVLAWIMWVGGLIASIGLAQQPDRWGDLQLNLGLFLAYYAGFLVIGATYWAIGELFNNVASIKDGINGLNRAKIKPEK